MHGDGELFLFNLIGFDEGLKVYAALILIVPTALVELQIDAAVVDVPVIVKPAGLIKFLFQVSKNFFYIFHFFSNDFPTKRLLREPMATSIINYCDQLLKVHEIVDAIDLQMQVSCNMGP